MEAFRCHAPKGIPAYRLLQGHGGQAQVICIEGSHYSLGVFDSAGSKERYEELVRKLISERAARSCGGPRSRSPAI